MKKRAVLLGRMIVILLLLAGLSVCTMPDQAANTPPEDALSFDQLLEGLDGLQGSATQSPSAPGLSVFSLPNGSLLGSADLSSYINAIKRDLAAYIYACTEGRPYLVVASRVTWPVDGGDTESGLVWVPFTWGRRKSFPVIAFQHGTQVYRECAPSRFNPNPFAVLSSPDLTGALQNYVECVVGGLMASAGYIVVMPDYPGFGSSSQRHPYVHLSLGDSVRDIVTVTLTALAGRTVSANGIVHVTGYSEGGYATMAGAMALQPLNAAHQLALGKIVPCDGAYSLSGVMLGEMLDQEPELVPSYLLYTAAGYQSVYGSDDIDYFELLKPDYAAGLIAVDPFDGDHTNAFVSALGLPSVAREMILGVWPFVPEVLQSGGSVYDCLAENDAWQGWGSTPRPVFVHCPLDDVVPVENAVAAATALGMNPFDPAVIHLVPPIPLVAQVMGSIHVGAFPTAMLEAFKIIRN